MKWKTSAAVLAAAFAMCACGKSEPTPSAVPAAPVIPAVPSAPGAAAPTEGAQSSVATPAPTAATGCPATDAMNAVLPGTVHSAYVQGPEVWTLAGSPHRLPEGIEVAENAIPTIEPCARVIVGDGRRVQVASGGTLIANGTSERPILFDSASPLPGKGLWHGVVFLPGARPASMLHHVTIEEAGGDSGMPAALWIDGDLALDLQQVRIVRSKRDGVWLAEEARFAPGASGLEVLESGIAEELSAPVHFVSANSVGSLPEGRYGGNAANEILVDGPYLRTTQTFRHPGPGVRYRLQAGLIVSGPTGAVLTVAPGTTLAFAPGKTLYVGTEGDGAVVLDGGSDETRIVLTSARPLPDAGDWAGIWIARGASRAATKLSYLTIEYAGFADGLDAVGCGDDAPAGIAIEERDLGPRIDHVRFANMAENAVGIARTLSAATATDYTGASLGMEFGNLRCRQTLARDADGACPDPIPPCR